MYDITKYTDFELFDFLNLNEDVSDYDLEYTIIEKINYYKNEETIGENKKELLKFFNDIYEHFFDINSSESVVVIQEKINEETKNENQNLKLLQKSEKSIQIQNIQENFEDKSNSEKSIQIQNIQENFEDKSKSITLTQNVEYSKDYLNPLLKQTIKRIISIDSQYRTNKSDLPTNFTFNLSEPIRDVVALRLYSVQIPYTWYTISNDYGSNFFYLKSATKGINNGLWDYQIQINSGNYTSVALSDAINKSIQQMITTYTDVSFGTTSVSYNNSTNLMTLNIDLQLFFNETCYYLDFLDRTIPWTSPNNNTYPPNQDVRYSSTIAAYLGYNYQKYQLNTIYSLQNCLPPYNINNPSLNDTQKMYILDSTNNYFKIIQYISPIDSNNRCLEYKDISSQTQYIVNTITITLSRLSIQPNFGISPTYSRIDIANEIDYQIKQSSYFLNPSFSRIDISNTNLNSNPSFYDFDTKQSTINLINAGNSYYALCLPLNRKTTYNAENVKSVVIFPNDTSIWFDSPPSNSSCFHFSRQINELNNIFGETNTHKTNYDLSYSPIIEFKCITEGYNPPPIQIDISGTIQNNVNNPYSLSDYINAINNAIGISNIKTINSSNRAGVLNPLVVNGSGTGFIDSITDECIEFKIDITKIYSNEYYILNLNLNLNSFFNYNKLLYQNDYIVYDTSKLQEYNYDLSTNNIFTFKINKTASYTLSKDILLLSINPKPITDNQTEISNSKVFNVYSIENLSNTIEKTITIIDYINSIQKSIKQFCDVSYSNTGYYSHPLQNSSVILSYNDETYYYITINIVVNKILTQNDYSVSFYDVSSQKLSQTNTWFTDSSWYKNLKIQNQTYNLVDLPNYSSVFSKIISYTHPEITKQYLNVNGINIYGDINDIQYDSLTNTFFANNRYDLSGGRLSVDVSYINISNYTIENGGYLKQNDTSSNYFSINTADLCGNTVVDPYTLFLKNPTSFYIRPYSNGYLSSTDSITITIPAGTYTRNSLVSKINSIFSNNPITKGSYIDTYDGLNNDNIPMKIRININKVYTSLDYNLVFYDSYSYVKCFIGAQSVRNTSWDSTLGWLLGFRNQTIYNLSNYSNIKGMSIGKNNILTFSGDTVVCLNLYNYLLIILDDFTQSHLNDGLITLTNQEHDTSLPSYSSSMGHECDLSGNSIISLSRNNTTHNCLTQNQMYATEQIYIAQQQLANNTYKLYNQGPFVQDIFGLVPIKTSGLSNGSYYVEFGGTLQNQERLYFGPVNISRLSIKLLNDRGNIVNLNNSNWSFSFVCEQLYQQNKL